MTRAVLAAALGLAAFVALAGAAGAQIGTPSTTPPPPPTTPTTVALTPTTEPVGGVVTTAPHATTPTTAVRRTTTSSTVAPSTTLFTVPTPQGTPSGAAPSAAPRTGNGEISGFYALLSVFGFIAVAALLTTQWFLTRPGRRGRTL